MTTQPLHVTLWEENLTQVQACSVHPFVQGLGDGTLDADAFRGYVAQDAFFLGAFFSAYALATAKAVEQIDVAQRLHRLMGGVLDELKLHEGYAESLSIELVNVRPYPATRAYTDFLLHTAWTAEVGEIVAAMTPCMRLYAHLGQGLATHDQSGNPYRDWIATYSSPEFEALASELESLLDHLAEDSREVAGMYRYAMRCEFDFFTACLPSDGDGGTPEIHGGGAVRR